MMRRLPGSTSVDAQACVADRTDGGQADADPVTAASTGVVEEFLLRPTEANWSNFLDVANLVNRRLSADDPSPYVVLDSHPGTLPRTDNRVRTGVLAYYYLLADPDRTMLMFFGGVAPSAAWSTSWIPAVSRNVGQPLGAMGLFAQGSDPENAALISAFANYANGIKGSEPYMPAEMKGAPEVEIPAEAHAAGYFLTPCTPEVTELYTRIWTDLLK